jgi:hypothetical protein
VARILSKLGLRGRAEAAALAAVKNQPEIGEFADAQAPARAPSWPS